MTVEAVVSSDAREDLYFLLTLIFLDLHLVRAGSCPVGKDRGG
jgi:hypothetical protein